jgi:hypothetical protein
MSRSYCTSILGAWAIIRASADKANDGKKYEFTQKDVPALQALVAEHTRKETEKRAVAKK